MKIGIYADVMPTIASLLGAFPAQLVLVVAAIMLAAESGLLIGVILPGASVAMALGLFARGGAFPLYAAIIVAVLATISGSQYGFFRGRQATSRLTRWVERKVGADRERRLLDGIRTRARWAVGAAHCVAVVRTLVPRLSGRADVPHFRFTAADSVGAIVWAGGVTTLGYLAGAAYDTALRAVGFLGLPAILVVAAAIVIWRLTHRHRSVHEESS